MKRLATILIAVLGMAGGAWAQSLLDPSGPSPYDPPRPRTFQKHDHVQIVVEDLSIGVSFTVTSEVADVRPNGTLVLQATRRRKVNDQDQVLTLTAEAAPQSVEGGRVRSDKLARMNLVCDTGARKP